MYQQYLEKRIFISYQIKIYKTTKKNSFYGTLKFLNYVNNEKLIVDNHHDGQLKELQPSELEPLYVQLEDVQHVLL